MKKIFVTLLLFLTIPTCHAQEQSNQIEHNEIRLDTNFQTKKYNLTKPNYSNDIKSNYDDNDEYTPFNFTSSPLQLLKQYQQDEL